MLSERAKNVEASPTLALAAQAKALKEEGKDVISLTVGEPDWNSFSCAVEAGIQAIQEGKTKYTPASGIPELRKAIAEDYNKKFATQYKAENVTVSAGAKFILYSAIQAMIDPGDEVIVPSPYWVSYPEMVKMLGGEVKVIACEKESEFKLLASDLEKNISPKTRLLLLNSPSNPTGMEYSRAELEEMAEVLRKHPQVAILSDDIYNLLSFNSEKISPHLLQVAPDLTNRCVCVNGASKAFSMTGWRVGWALGPKDLVQAMSNFQSQTVSCAPNFAQYACLQAIQKGEPERLQALELLKKRKSTASAKILSIEGLGLKEPQGAFYLWVDVKNLFGKKFQGVALQNSQQVCEQLLKEKLIATVPGSAFGLEGYIRLSYALSEERMSEALERLQEFSSALV